MLVQVPTDATIELRLDAFARSPWMADTVRDWVVYGAVPVLGLDGPIDRIAGELAELAADTGLPIGGDVAAALNLRPGPRLSDLMYVRPAFPPSRPGT
jgi:hypothetical protein